MSTRLWPLADVTLRNRICHLRTLLGGPRTTASTINTKTSAPFLSGERAIND